MKIHKIKQQTSPWYLLKYAKIGGTRTKSLMLKSKTVEESTLFFEMLSELTHEYEEPEGFSNKYTDHGNEYEPKAREKLMRQTGIQFKEYGLIEFDQYDCLSPDGLNEDFTIGCEIKCPSPKVFEEYMYKYKEVPVADYSWQLAKYFKIPTLERLYYTVFSPTQKYSNIHSIELTRASLLNIGTDKKQILLPISELLEQYEERKTCFVSALENKLSKYKSNLDF